MSPGDGAGVGLASAGRDAAGLVASAGAGSAWGQALAAIGAQVVAETRTRLRSTGTIFTVLLLFAAAFAYLPAPDSNRVSISWQLDEKLYSGEYTASYIGAVVAVLTSLLLPFVGFYLVTGSVKRDLQQRVWPIVAATRTSPAAYLLGKWLAGFTYLLVCAALSLVPALVLFYRYGSGPFSLWQLALPWLLTVPPAMAFTAAMALVFDVTPGLRSRGGYVLWFFVWAFVMLLLPAKLGGRLDEKGSNDTLPSYDPVGMVFIDHLVARAIGRPPEGLSMGVMITDQEIHRVPFPALELQGDLLVARAQAALWTAAPLLLAIAIFRLPFARSLRPARERTAKRVATAAWQTDAATAIRLAEGRRMAPGFLRSVLAEIRLIWSAASWLKYPLLLAGLAAGLIPGDGTKVALIGFFLLLGPPIAEAAARERLEGTAATVFTQPGVPLSRLLWKLSAVAAFVVLLGAPALLRALGRGADSGLCLLLGLLFVATAATGLGWLTHGGKLFLAAYTALWYIAIQDGSPLDFTGAFSGVDVARCATFAAIGLGCCVVAAVVDRAEQARG